jgi:protein gp37
MSKIPYTEVSWNPITGCTPASEGCDHCYARAMASRFNTLHPGQFSLLKFWKDRLDIPLKWRKPRRIFVGTMTDMFHEQVRPEWLAQVFNIMASATLQNCRCKVHTTECWTGEPHTYLMLTKRPQNMAPMVEKAIHEINEYFPYDCAAAFQLDADRKFPWPNVWMGITAENQARYDERILPFYQAFKGNRRWVSLEPLLGPICLRLDKYPIHWVVVGCESGPGRRPCPHEWIHDIVRQCRIHKVPCFVKQVWSHNAVIKDPMCFYYLFASSVAEVQQYPHWGGA